ncbi:MAG: PmoA family protein [Anaerolineae bacterium]|nr:PmoA family protein [Anaerolineae bacterium]
MMQTTFASGREDYIDYTVDGVTLLRYVYRPHVLPVNVPKPFIHPLRTLGGAEVTARSPHDHPWHTGLAMTMPYLQDRNFWGGPSFVMGEGYKLLDSHGRIEHVRFDEIKIDVDAFALNETVAWKPDANTVWLHEARHISVAEINRAEAYWVLTYHADLRNVTTTVMTFGSPTTHGRPMAGYGSYFWRGPRAFMGAGGRLLGPEERDNYMGVSLPWLAYVGQHDESDAKSTLLFVDDPANPRYPNKWFARKDLYPGVSFSFMFDETYQLAPGDTLSLTYHVAICDGARAQDELARIAHRVAH